MITYEWVCQRMYGIDIFDNLFAESYVQAEAERLNCDFPCCISLVKYEGDNIAGETNRTYALMVHVVHKGLRLPEAFDDGSAIPKRFLLEVESYVN